MGGKRFGLLLCADDPEYVKKVYGGYFGVFVTMLGEEGEKWDLYRVARGEFPPEEEVGMYDGFVISGSCNDAHGDDVWICKLLNLVKKAYSMNTKVLGICFGHQILSRAMGGTTGRAVTGWDFGVRTIQFSSSSIKLFSSLKLSSSQLSIIKSHRDEVWELPPKAELIAWSDKTGIEIFRYGNHLMGIQGHPEYTNDILYHLIDRLLQRKDIAESYAEELRAKVGAHEPDAEAWKKMCRGFLKGRLW